MAEVEIIPAKTVTHVKHSIGEMPTMKSSAAPPPAPPVPSVSGLPKQEKAVGAPPVPPPLEPTVKPIVPAQRKVAREIMDKLRNRNAPQPEPEKPAAPAPEPAAKEAGEVEEPKEATADQTKPGEKAKTKVNPWKLLDEWKGKASELEKQLLETKKLIKDEATAKAEAERYQKIEARAKELEDHIKFVDYTKSAEFTEKYHKPYEEAWKRAIEELNELTVTDPDTGEERKPAATDLMALAQLPLKAAKAKAEELFGEFADEMMAHRKELIRLFHERDQAINRAKTEAVERDKRSAEESKLMQDQLRSFAKETWEKINQEAMADPENGEFFKPVEGDEERNTLLTKGYELVDSASAESPLAPGLTNEQRQAIIKRHVAVRNRSAAYGVLKHELKKARAEAAELKQKLAQYEGSVPNVAGSTATGNHAQIPARASAQVFEALRKLARH